MEARPGEIDALREVIAALEDIKRASNKRHWKWIVRVADSNVADDSEIHMCMTGKEIRRLVGAWRAAAANQRPEDAER